MRESEQVDNVPVPVPLPLPLKNIAIIGCGRLGLCAALVFEKKGFDVLAVDIVPAYVAQLNRREFETYEPSVERFLKASKHFRATTSLDEAVAHSQLLMIFVDTPTGDVAEKIYDHSKLSGVLQQLNRRRLRGKHVVICCTVLPGYIATEGSTLLSDCEDTSLSYNPEFIAQGTIIANLLAPDMVLIGEGSKAAGDLLQAVSLRSVDSDSGKPVVCRMNTASAEITKLSLNCFITMKISYANMIGDIADASCSSDGAGVGADVGDGANKFDILRAIGADSRVGAKCLLPGYGFGGPCFPRDNRALAAYSHSVGVDAKLSRATDDFNRYHANRMADTFERQDLEQYVFESVAYKDNCAVPIIEESQKLLVARLLAQRGKSILVRDTQVIVDEVKKAYGSMFHYEVIRH